MVALKKSIVDNRCHFCTKVFCCSECRVAHENNKHAEINSSKPKCPLCFKFDLLYDPRLNSAENEFDRAQLVCHVVINHLPLRCKICGNKFENNQAFQSVEPCKGPIRKRQTVVTTTPLAKLASDDSNKSEEFVTPVETKLSLTPEYHIEGSATNKSVSSAGLANLKNPENFDSPPELARQTSTPMHVNVVSLQKYLTYPPSVPEFNLKTPVWQRTFDSTASTCGSAVSVTGESKYFTADIDRHMLRLSLEGYSNSTSNRESQGTPSWSSPVIPILKKLQLEKQNSGDDSPTSGTSYRAERSILKSALLSRIYDSSRDTSEKRVRFSDQFATPVLTTTPMADTSACDNDVFFEARESLDDDDAQEEVKCNSPVIKQLEEKKVENLVDNGESKVNPSTTSTSAVSSSRVVMMLLVERTDNAKGFSSLDLAPLINSGLKKLEESAAASIHSSKTDNGNLRSSTGTIAKTTSEITSYTREIDGSLTETSKGCRRRASFKDTFVTITDRIECVTPPPHRRDTTTEDQERELAHKADSLIGAATQKSDGIFSAVARVVRSAFKKLPAAVTVRNLSREPIPAPISNSPLAVVTVDSHAATALVHRSSIKRPRERIDSHDEIATTTHRESPGSVSSVDSGSSTRTNNSSSNELVVKSPAAKRHRGWYRIRAREPIARMRKRQVVTGSPRGASREIQRFQQGALSIGATFLPLPSRAHQSTQTED